jgi:hypothetical protein
MAAPEPRHPTSPDIVAKVFTGGKRGAGVAAVALRRVRSSTGSSIVDDPEVI